MKYADLRQYDIANGEGIHCTLFVSGCHFHCQGCFNKEAQNFNYGQEFDKQTEERFYQMCLDNEVDAISILGGEPFDQIEIDDLLKKLKQKVGKPIWVWSGFLFDELIKTHREALNYIDILVDGQFDLSKRSLMLKWRGSTNQRVIDVKESLIQNQIVLYCE